MKKNVWAFTFFIFNISCVSPTQKLSVEKNSLLEKIQTTLQTSFEKTDVLLFSALSESLKSFQELSLSHYESSMKIAQTIMYTSGLTPPLYEFSLGVYTLAKLAEQDHTFAHSFPADMHPAEYDFNDLQADLCKSLCESMGWNILAQNDPSVFTLEGMNKSFLQKRIFSKLKIELTHINPHNFILLTDAPFPFEASGSSEFFNGAVPVDPGNTGEKSRLQIDKERSLKLFLSGKFEESIKSLNTLKKKNNEPDVVSLCEYWIGRNYLALKNFALAEKYFLLSGKASPLGLYDALSGQILKRKSGRTSTTALSPFADEMLEEKKSWGTYPGENNFNPKNIKDKFNINLEFIKKTLKLCMLQIARIMVENNMTSMDQIQNYLSASKNNNFVSDSISIEQFADNFFLEKQVNWLKHVWPHHMEACCTPKLQNYINSTVLWIDYSISNYLEATFFLNQVKDNLDFTNPDNNFLYYIFYPLPYKEKFRVISKKYEIDKDILYAIYRQDNLFFFEPTTEALEKSAALIKELKNKYNGNLVYMLCAYKAGSEVTDRWIKQISSHDDVIFMEIIQDQATQKFLHETLRNYYNIKWIYSKTSPRPWWEKLSLFNWYKI